MFKETKYQILLLIIMLFPSLTLAEWTGPTEVVQGKWGSGVNDFGYEFGFVPLLTFDFKTDKTCNHTC